MQVKEVMTQPVESVSPECTLQHASETMRARNIGALPVCENGRPIGMVTDRDIAVRGVAAGQHPSRATVREIMSEKLISCQTDETIDAALKLMKTQQVRRLPIVDRDHQLVGILSVGDIAVRVHDDRMTAEVFERVSEPTTPNA